MSSLETKQTAISVTGQWSDWYLQELPSMQTSVQPAGLASRIDNWSICILFKRYMSILYMYVYKPVNESEFQLFLTSDNRCSDVTDCDDVLL